MTSRVFHLCSLFSWVLWISSKQASSTTTLTPSYGFDVKTKQCPTGHTERLLKLFWWENTLPRIQLLPIKFGKQLPLSKAALTWVTSWCVQSCVCCSQTVLNVKYYWAPFYRIEFSVLLLSDRIQFLGTMLVSVSCLEGHTLFNDVSFLLFLFSHLCIPSVWIQIPREMHIQGVHLDLASSMRAKYVWQWGVISGTPGLGEGKVRIWNGLFSSIDWEILIAIRSSLLMTPLTVLWISRCRSQAFLWRRINSND